jgi:hypothetical protein
MRGKHLPQGKIYNIFGAEETVFRLIYVYDPNDSSFLRTKNVRRNYASNS